MEPSPYLPTSRRFVNPLYLRVEAIPEFAYVRQRGRYPQDAAVAAGECAAHRADRPGRGVGGQARARSKASTGSKRSAGRELAYEAYPRTRGPQPRRLRDLVRTGGAARRGLASLAQEVAPPGAAGVAEFAAKHAETVDFHRWLQWQLDDQLATAQSTAVRAGMELGIMHDLAVGVDPNGADAWAHAGRACTRRHRGRTAGRVQPAGPGLVAAAVATRPARRPGLRAVPGDGQRDAAARGRRSHRPHHRAVPAVVDPEGRRCPPTAPTCGTTTRR